MPSDGLAVQNNDWTTLAECSPFHTCLPSLRLNGNPHSSERPLRTSGVRNGKGARG